MFGDCTMPRSSIAAIRAGVRADLAPDGAGSTPASSDGRRGSGGVAGVNATARPPATRSPAHTRRRPRPRGVHRLHHSPVRTIASLDDTDALLGLDGGGSGGSGSAGGDDGPLAVPLGKAGTLPSLGDVPTTPAVTLDPAALPSTSSSTGPSGVQVSRQRQLRALSGQHAAVGGPALTLGTAPTAASLIPPHVLSHGVGGGGSWMSAGSDFTISPHDYSPFPESPPRRLVPTSDMRPTSFAPSDPALDDVGGGSSGAGGKAQQLRGPARVQ